jgi:hypothetical protein
MSKQQITALLQVIMGDSALQERIVEATDLDTVLLHLASVGEVARQFGGMDRIAKILSNYSSDQLGDGDLDGVSQFIATMAKEG